MSTDLIPHGAASVWKSCVRRTVSTQSRDEVGNVERWLSTGGVVINFSKDRKHALLARLGRANDVFKLLKMCRLPELEQLGRRDLHLTGSVGDS